MAGSEVQVRIGTNPYVGPRPFETGENLFGRAREITELCYLLSAERIVLLHSPSGAGKSSLIQAGLIPRLRERFDVWRPTRVSAQPPDGIQEDVNRYALSAALGFEQGIPENLRRSPSEIAGMSLSEYAKKRPPRPSAPANKLLIFDQFEEILTIDPLAVDAKRNFFDQLGELLHDPLNWALFAMREDYLAPLDPYAEQVPTHLKNRFRIDLLGLEEAREAIATPSLEAGREFSGAAVEKLVRDLATMKVQQPDGSFLEQTGLHVEPLQLQVVCRRLWERIPPDSASIGLEDVERFGDVTEALSGYYAAEVAKIADGVATVERAIREWVDEKLITLDGIRSQVLKGAGTSEGLANNLIASLVNTHLVRAEQRAGAVWYELAHDRLIKPVRTDNAHWFKANLSPLQREAAIWDQQHRPKSALLRGRTLLEAERWASDHNAELTSAETDFLAASRDGRRWSRVYLAMGVSSVLFAVLAATTLFWATLEHREMDEQNEVTKAEAKKRIKEQEDAANKEIDHQKANAEREKEDANNKQLAAAAKLTEANATIRLATAVRLATQAVESIHIDKRPELSLLLALESIKATKPGDPQTSVPENALRDALANSGGQVFATHEAVSDIALSPNGRWLATTIPGDGRNAKPGHLWDLTNDKSGPQDLEGASGPVKITPDGRWLITGSNDSTARAWDLSKKPIEGPTKLGAGKTSAGPNGLRVTAGTNRLITTTGSFVTLWNLDHPSDQKSPGELIDVSPDGNWLLTATKKANCLDAYLWDLKDFDAKPIALAEGVSAIVGAFSADSLVTASGYCSDSDNGGESVQMWRLKGPEKSTTLTGGSTRRPLKIAISPDSRRVVLEAQGERDAALWDLAKVANHPESHPQQLPLPEIGSIDRFVFNVDGNWLHGFPAESVPNKNVWIWQLPGGTLRPFQDTNRTQVAYQNEVFSPDGRWVFLFSGSEIIVLDLTQSNPTNNPAILVGHESNVESGDVQPAKRAAVTRSVDGTIRLWDLTTSAPITSPLTFSDSCLSADRRWLLTLPDNGNDNGRLWNLTSGVLAPAPVPLILPERDKAGPNQRMTCKYSNNGRWLVTTQGEAAQLWDTTSPAPAFHPLPGEDKADPRQPMAVTFTNDNRWLVTTQRESARLWNLDFAHSGLNPVLLGAVKPYLSPDGRWLVTISNNDNAARLWDLNSPEPAFRPLPGDDKADPKQQMTVTFSDDSRWMLTTQREATRLWNLASDPGAEPVSFAGDNHFFSPESNWLVTISRNDNTAKYWHLTRNGATAQPLPGYAKTETEKKTTAQIRSVSLPFATFSLDDHWLAFWDGNIAQLWDLTSPVPVPRPLRMDDQPGPVTMTFSNDGNWLATTQGGVAWMWDLTSTQPGASPIRLDDLLRSRPRFSPDGHWLLTATRSGGGHLHDLRGKHLARAIPLPGFAGQFGEATFSEDGRWLWVGGGKPYLWELPGQNGSTVPDPIYLPPGNGVFVGNIEFSPDGRWIVGHSYARTLLWSTRLREDLIPLACRTAGRNFTSDEWSTFLPGEPYHKTCPEFPPGKGVQPDYKADSAGSRAALR